ncbi:hypothetical protein [Megalodesulfovibrio paquesii]
MAVKKSLMLFGGLLGCAFFLAATLAQGPAPAHAHSALCACVDNGNGTITCEGGFSDGASATGVRVFVRDNSDTTLHRGEMDALSTFTFPKPEGEYTVIFDAGPGHQVEVQSRSITP